MKLPISIIVLTFNEEKNIACCLQSVSDFAEDIYIVDSFSTDNTLEIAKQYNAQIYQHPFETQAKQLNWALNNLPIKTEWIMRLDADERVTEELADELCEKLLLFPPNITGLYFKRKVYFMGKWIRHGGYYPTWLLRIWREGFAVCEERCMDEHMKITNGELIMLDNDIVENNKKSLSDWIKKHNNYAEREASEYLFMKNSKSKRELISGSITGNQMEKKRWLNKNIYSNMPLFLRSLCYFFYRYFLRLGFLDGKEGLIFHFLQGLWYRFLVDAKITEQKIKA